MKTTLKILFSLLLLTTFYLLFSGTLVAHAQSSSIATQRGLYDIELVPGSSHDDVIVIYNLDESQPLAAHGELTLWDLEGDSDEIAYVTAEPGFNAAKWFSYSNGKKLVPLVSMDFIINPDHRKEIPIRIAAPKDAAAGTYLVMARFRALAAANSDIRIAPELNILFFIKVARFSLEGGVETDYNAEILEAFIKDEDASEEQGTLVAHAGVLDDAIETVVAKIKNTGLYYFRADGRLQLKNMFGRVVKEVQLPKRYLLPNKVRTIEIPMDPQQGTERGFWSSVGHFFTANSYFGPYTATVFLNFPQSTSQTDVGFASASVLERSITVWILPWKFWLPVLMVLTLLFLVLKRGRGRVQKALRILLRGK